MTWTDVDRWYAEGAPATDKETEEVLKFAKLKKCKAKSYSDGDFPARAVGRRRSIKIDVMTAKEARMTRRGGEHHLAFARKTCRILLTCDGDFLNLRRFPLIQSPKVVVCDFGTRTDTKIGGVLFPVARIADYPQRYGSHAQLHVRPNGGWREHVKCRDGEDLNERFRLYKGRVEVRQDEGQER
jgi:hypothetical protein